MTDSPELHTPIGKRCRTEIEDLHQFFEGWLSGRLPNTEAAFERVERALESDFQLIHPSGEWRDREEILTGLRRAHKSQPGLDIEIRDVRLRASGEDLVLATYEEWQQSESGFDGRLSTVAFHPGGQAPNGLRWAHVHETWIQGPEKP
jgi:hypothetical protein